MPKHSLQRRPPMAGIMKPGRFGVASGDAGVTARAVRDFAAFSILARKGQVAAAAACLSGPLEAIVTDGPKRVARGSLSVSGIAPGQWLVIERDPSSSSISGLLASLAGLAAVVEQSDSRFILELTGKRVLAALAKGVPADLDASVFAPGDVAQTIAAHIGLQVSLMTEQPAYELVSAASTAASFWSWLTVSAAEFGLDVV
jgi:methylglutamate dehydrogenase subunit D